MGFKHTKSHPRAIPNSDKKHKLVSVAD